jgi:hypothetical protein
MIGLTGVAMRKCAVIAAAMLLLSCGDAGLCENSSQVEIPSPDKKLGAWVFIRGCGATASNSVHVTVLPAGSLPPVEAGNTFVREPVSEVRVEWPSERELLITHQRGGNVSRQEREIAGVAVSYHVE